MNFFVQPPEMVQWYEYARNTEDYWSKGSTINHLGGGRAADFREQIFFSRRPSERIFFPETLRTNFFIFFVLHHGPR